MQSMHRQFGKLMKRSADDSQVSVLLKDFDNADKLLAKVQTNALYSIHVVEAGTNPVRINRSLSQPKPGAMPG